MCFTGERKTFYRNILKERKKIDSKERKRLTERVKKSKDGEKEIRKIMKLRPGKSEWGGEGRQREKEKESEDRMRELETQQKRKRERVIVRDFER